MLIDCISDLHGHYPTLAGGDLLIIAGDLTAHDLPSQYTVFAQWLEHQDYAKKIYIAGNHDGLLVTAAGQFVNDPRVEYLCDSGTTFEGLRIWGSPWTPRFCRWHFMKDRGAEIRERWNLIPDDTDILITHGPPQGIADFVARGEHVGCVDLWSAIKRCKPRLHVFGHVHEGYGQTFARDTMYVNCAHMNEHYQPVNPPIRVEL